MKAILIVEEDTSLSKAYQEKLQTADCQVIIATTGNEALTICHSQKPDVILLDIMLPGGLNGLDVLEQLKRNERWRSIPVVVVTNLDSVGKTAKTIGANDYLVKANTSLEQISQTVHKYLE